MRGSKTMRGMTLLEMLVAMAIFGVVMLTIGHAITMMQNTWTKVRGKADGFRNTRLALDVVAGRIAQATLNQRLKFEDTATGTGPQYVTDSDLHFVSGPAQILLSNIPGTVGHAVFFQAPFGESDPKKDSRNMRRLNSTLNAWGYFVEYGPDKEEKPAFMNGNPDRFPPRKRFRLMEFRQPASELSLFDMNDRTPPELKINKATGQTELFSWFQQPLRSGLTLQSRHLTVVAENILAFIVTPLDPRKRDANSDLSTSAPYEVAPNSRWNSRGFQLGKEAATNQLSQRHNLPPAVQLTVIAISEDAWLMYSDGQEDQARLDAVCSRLMLEVSNLFDQGDRLARDIATITDSLDAIRPRIPYRIITLLVPLSKH